MPWGVTTRKGTTTYAHVLDITATSVVVPMADKPRRVVDFRNNRKLPFRYDRKQKELIVDVTSLSPSVDRIVVVETR